MSEEKYFNRDLSWIDFNARVLAEAQDTANPLMERLKFIGIVCSNFDEFFMVRVASVQETEKMLHEIYIKAFHVMRQQDSIFLNELLPEMEKAGIRRIASRGLSEGQRAFLKDLFDREIFPLLTPIALRRDMPLPTLVHLSLYRIFEVKPQADSVQEKQFVVVEIPRNLSRVLWLPLGDHQHSYILLEDVITLFAEQLFKGHEILASGLLRITRGAEMSVGEEKDEDFAQTMSDALRQRRLSYIVRLEISGTNDMVQYFKERLNVDDDRIYQAGDWLSYRDIAKIAHQNTFDHLRRPDWVPQPVAAFEDAQDIWAVIKEQDVMMHLPYQSFDAFIRFLSDAAKDPEVLAIKQTLYRMAEPSLVIKCLEKAAENGKQVTVLVELKARFDEERNIEWAKRLMNAGATVLYGVAGYKTHAKASLVVRREPEGIKRYVYLATGNFNERTAKLYSDVGIFTAKEEIARDVSHFFNVITGYTQAGDFSKISIAPYGLRRKLERLILRESLRTRKEQPGLIMAKMNALVDPEIIDALYRASKAGVQIKLNVRGICCLRPGVKGLSENIEVVSIVDMFLEHSRIFYFYNGGDNEVYLSSADWMPRNLDKRIEILLPVEDEKNKRGLVELLNGYFHDNQKAWRLMPEGEYEKIPLGEDRKFRIQEKLCQQFADGRKRKRGVPEELQPQLPKREAARPGENRSGQDILIIPPENKP